MKRALTITKWVAVVVVTAAVAGFGVVAWMLRDLPTEPDEIRWHS